MRGAHEASPEPAESGSDSAEIESGGSRRSVVFVPFTFPLAIGGAIVGLPMAFRAGVIAATLLASGFTRLVTDVVHNIKVL